MRFSAVSALCAAPLVLAGALESNFVARQAPSLEVRTNHLSENKQESSKEVKEVGNGNKVTIVQSTVSDIVIIWVNNGGGAATSTVTETKTVTAGAGQAGAPAAVATHQVVVGGAAGLVFSPESVSAAVGDMVVFTFMSNNHTVTQSAFDTPCKKLPEGMDSGFMPNVNNTIVPAPQMAMQVTVATPIWFYCRAKTHCGKGMTFSINPTAAKSQANFKALAVAQNGTGTASPIVGGSAAAPAPAASTAAAPPAAAAPAAAAPAPVSPAPNAMVGGTGTLVNGACACSCLCGAATFPNVAVQGVGAFGGISGAMPMAALEA